MPKLLKCLIDTIRNDLEAFLENKVAEEDDIELLVAHLNVQSKLIVPLRYQIMESQEIRGKLASLSEEERAAYGAIKTCLANNMDVNQFLSKKSRNPRFGDALLLHWRIHHLHLNATRSPDNYFTDRSDHILLVLFDRMAAYFLDIQPHGCPNVFSMREYPRIIRANWPYLLETNRLAGVIPEATTSLSDANMAKFNKNQINYLIPIGDSVFFGLGGGVTTANAGLGHLRKALQLRKIIKGIEDLIANGNLDIGTFVKTNHPSLEAGETDLFFGFNDSGELCLEEKHSRLVLVNFGPCGWTSCFRIPRTKLT